MAERGNPPNRNKNRKYRELSEKLVAMRGDKYDFTASNRRNKAIDVAKEREFKKRGWRMSADTSQNYSWTDPKTKVRYSSS